MTAFADLPPEQRAIYDAVDRLAEARGEPLVPLSEVATHLGISVERLLARLTPPLLDHWLNFREDKPKSAGWLAIDQRPAP